MAITISEESLNDFSELEVIVHCFYEMTFVGFSETDIQKRINEIEKRMTIRKSDSKEKNVVSAALIHKLLRE